ncbi:MAG: GAF domain-containing protein [Candidatus Sulfotelmatobacter sp.]
MEQWLGDYVQKTGAVAGSAHVRQGDGLALAAAVNLPPPVIEAVRWVPWGKGMAGVALETGEAVTTCNLKEDDSGRVKPGAKAVSAQAAIALPVKNATGFVVAVVGVAFKEEREIGQPEIERLTAAASTIPLEPSAN